jgi:hypothetical protein
MTVSVDDRRRTYPNGDGVTTQFNGPMAYDPAHIQAFLTDLDNNITQIPSANITVELLGREKGTRVTLDDPQPVDTTLLLLRTVPVSQEVDITNEGDFNASVIEKMADLIVMQNQQINDGLERSVRVSDAVIDDVDVSVIPAPLKFWRWNGAGNGIDFVDVGPVTTPGGSDLVGFVQGAASAVPRTQQDKDREDWSAGDFAGIDFTGVADSTAALNAFIQEMALTGRKGLLPAGTIRVTDTIRIGNRLPSLPSTLNGVSLIGAGWGKTATTMNANAAATRILYDGPSDGRPVIYIDGPISGVRLEGFMIDCNGKSVVGLRDMRSFHVNVRQVLIVNWANNFAVEIGASTPNSGYGGAAPISHLYEQLDMQNPGPGAHSLDISNGNGNCNQLMFLRCYFDRYNDISTIGVRLGYCDHITFIGCHVAQTGSVGASGISYMVRPQPGFPQFPQNIEVIGGSQAGGVTFDNTLETWNAGPYPGIIFDTYKTADGAPIPPKTANGGADAPGYMFRGVTDNGVPFGWSPTHLAHQLTAASTIAPVSPVVLLSSVVAVDIANITPPRQVFSGANGGYELTIIPTFTESESVFLRLVAGGNIATPMMLKNLVAVKLIYNEGTGFWSLANGGASSGKYTPTHGSLTNLDSTTPRECQWLRVGNTVHVTGRLEADPTAAADTATSLEMSLPVTPAVFANNWDCAGAGSAAGSGANGNRSVVIIGSGSNARLQWQSNQTATQGVTFAFSYQLQ